jgi:folylpolyglutamate synthase/dihydropteroate synthase
MCPLHIRYQQVLISNMKRTKFGIKPGVKRMEWMLERLNNPQFNINGIHVGGLKYETVDPLPFVPPT